MKKIVSMMALGLMLMSPAASYAQKIGYVVANNVFVEYDKMNGISDKIKAKFADKQKELEDLNAKLIAQDKEIKTNSLLMTESKLEDSKKKLQKMAIEFRQKEMGVQKEFQKAQSAEMGKFSQVVSEIINAYGKEKGYDIILRDGAAYVADSVNITSDIIKRLKKTKK